MDIRLTVTIEGTGDVLSGLIHSLSNLGPALTEGGAILDKGVTMAFAAGDRAWPALRPWTNEDRERLGFSPAHPILIRTGRYLASFQQYQDADEVGIESDDPRFQTLNYGGTTESGHHVPPRPVQDVFPDDVIDAAVEAIWQEIISD